MKTYRIKPLPLSKMEVDAGFLMFRFNYGKKINVPNYCWYLEGNDLKILVDTAVEASMATTFRGFPAEDIMSFEDALAIVDLKPDDIDLVIQTHLHWDHCANTSKCRNARVLVTEEELKSAFSPHPIQAQSYKKELLKDLKFVYVKDWGEVAPGIQLIPVPGHSAGTQAVAVNTDHGKAIITGFCCLKDNFEPPQDIREVMPVIAPGTHLSAIDAYESALRLKGLADILIPVHDGSFVGMESIP